LKSKSILFSDLIKMEDPEALYAEVRHIISIIYPSPDHGLFDVLLHNVFVDTLKLFTGNYPGYRECNTEYHDLRHTTDIFIASARLLHGAHIHGIHLSQESVMLALACAMLHDAGYIQTDDDYDGTGAKYTLVHVERSIEFVKDYFSKIGCPEDYGRKCSSIIQCTNLSVNIADIAFESEQIRMAALIIGTADLIGQMADRNYIEKLLFLFCEFEEGAVKGFTSEIDLLRKTIGFYEFIDKRLSGPLENVNTYLRYHFKERWGKDEDLYGTAIQRNFDFLNVILNDRENNYRTHLKRGGIVKRLEGIGN
jgi:hypothetical protein